jgi:acetyl esterase
MLIFCVKEIVMPLNPQTKALIEYLLKNGKPLAEITVEEGRAAADRLKDMTEKPQKVKSVEDIIIPSEEVDILVKVYTPEGNKPFPALIYFFSGGFVWGDVETHDPIARALCNATKCKVFSVAYRLAPENKYPAAIHDAINAYKWIVENAENLNIDVDCLAVSGYSSGGNLAAQVARYARDEKMPLAYQILICAWLDLACSASSHEEFTGGLFCDKRVTQRFVESYLPVGVDPSDPKVSPFWDDNLQGLAPALVITAEYDNVRDEGKLYADKLKAASVDVIYSCYLGQIHQLLLYRRKLDQEKNPIDEIGMVLRQAFGSEHK